MGERGINREAATPGDIEEDAAARRGRLARRRLAFTTSRTYSHKTKTGELVPGHMAEEAELMGIGRALGAVGRGAFGMNSDFLDEAASSRDDAAIEGDGAPGMVPLDRPADRSRTAGSG